MLTRSRRGKITHIAKALSLTETAPKAKGMSLRERSKNSRYCCHGVLIVIENTSNIRCQWCARKMNKPVCKSQVTKSPTLHGAKARKNKNAMKTKTHKKDALPLGRNPAKIFRSEAIKDSKNIEASGMSGGSSGWKEGMNNEIAQEDALILYCNTTSSSDVGQFIQIIAPDGEVDKHNTQDTSSENYDSNVARGPSFCSSGVAGQRTLNKHGNLRYPRTSWDNGNNVAPFSTKDIFQYGYSNASGDDLSRNERSTYDTVSCISISSDENVYDSDRRGAIPDSYVFSDDLASEDSMDRQFRGDETYSHCNTPNFIKLQDFERDEIDVLREHQDDSSDDVQIVSIFKKKSALDLDMELTRETESGLIDNALNQNEKEGRNYMVQKFLREHSLSRGEEIQSFDAETMETTKNFTS